MSRIGTAVEELAYLRDLAADDALRAIGNLERSLAVAREEIEKGKDGSAMRPDLCLPNHQYLTEVSQKSSRFTALWEATGIATHR